MIIYEMRKRKDDLMYMKHNTIVKSINIVNKEKIEYTKYTIY